MKKKIAIYWARRDFRLHDNPALFAAIKHAKNEEIEFLPLFILEDYMIGTSPKDQFGYPSRFFLTKALPAFAQNFENFTVIQGKVVATMKALSEKFGITVFVNEDVHADFYTQLKKLKANSVDIKLYTDMLTVSKETKTGAKNIYSIFTPFKNAVWNEFCTAPVLPKANPSSVSPYLGKLSGVKTISCTEKKLCDTFSKSRLFQIGKKIYDVDSLISEKGEYDFWYTDETAAIKHFDLFLKNKIETYKKDRDILDIEGTSTMSVALAWGLASARFLREKIQKKFGENFVQQEGPAHYVSELIWREFYKYLSYHHPELMQTEFQQRFRGKIEWADKKVATERFEKWIQGKTGYPIVDAAMHQLAKTGYMHNRARMIVASVLTKNFGVDWRWGQEYFRAMLIDLDETSNNGGWQWGASVGADPKPIRIFNPYLQAENYDPQNLYQKKFLSKEYFEHPPEVIIEHKKARGEALERYGLSTSKDGFPRGY